MVWSQQQMANWPGGGEVEVWPCHLLHADHHQQELLPCHPQQHPACHLQEQVPLGFILHSRRLWWWRGNSVVTHCSPEQQRRQPTFLKKRKKEKMIPDHSELQPEQKKLDLHREEPLDYKVKWLATLSVVISVSTVLQLCIFMFCCSAAMSCLTLCDLIYCSTPGFPDFMFWMLLIVTFSSLSHGKGP